MNSFPTILTAMLLISSSVAVIRFKMLIVQGYLAPLIIRHGVAEVGEIVSNFGNGRQPCKGVDYIEKHELFSAEF